MNIKVDYNILSNNNLEEDVITNIINQNQLSFIFSNIQQIIFIIFFIKNVLL